MNTLVHLFINPPDDVDWSVEFTNLGVAWVIGETTIHWSGTDHQTRAVRMLRAAADAIEAGEASS